MCSQGEAHWIKTLILKLECDQNPQEDIFNQLESEPLSLRGLRIFIA